MNRKHESEIALARHKAGHIVMQRLQGCPLTSLTLEGPDLLVEDTPRQPFDWGYYLLVVLAGPAAEIECVPQSINLNQAGSEDIDRARELMEQHCFLRSDPTEIKQAIQEGGPVNDIPVSEALNRRFESVCEMLAGELPLIRRLADQLIQSRMLSTCEVEEIFTEYGQNKR